MTGMKRAAFAAAAAVAAASAFAAVPVAKGFAEWTCLDAKHHLSGRTLYPGDMRGRIAVVVVSDAANLKKALLDYGMLQTLADTTLKVVSWDTYWPKGDVVVMFSVAGGGGDEAVAEFLKAKDLDPKDLERLRRDISVYDGATFHGAPAVAGGYPYVYVLAPGAAEPLLAEKCDKKKTLANVKAAVAKGCKLLKPRKPYFGEVEEPKFYPQLAKSLETGKPAFGQVLGQIQKGVTSSNAEQAKEAQLLLDAFDQRRSELEFVINKCVNSSPHVAYAHIHELTQRWPAAKKDVEKAVTRIKSISGADKMCKLYLAVRKYADPAFVPKNAAEAKKIVGELKAAKQYLERMKKSKVPVLQNAAFSIAGEVERLVDDIPTRSK